MIPVTARTRQKAPVATWTLIVINTVVFLASYCLGPKAFLKIIYTFGLVPYYFLKGQRLYTLITSMFLHGNFEHLLGNMLYLLVFGPGVESRLGRAKFLVLYFTSGILAALAHVAIEAIFTEPIVVYGPFGYSVVDPLKIPCVGASGAISGILGAYMVLLPNVMLDVLTFLGPFPLVVRTPAIFFIMCWFFYQLYMGVLSLALPYPYFSGVAFWAHIGGFIAGLAIAPNLIRRKRKVRVIRIDYTGRTWYEVPVT